MINSFLALGGISDTLSPRTIVAEKNSDKATHFLNTYGMYVQFYKERISIKTTVNCTVGEIYMGTAGYLQGGYKSLILDTSRKIAHRTFT